MALHILCFRSIQSSQAAVTGGLTFQLSLECLFWYYNRNDGTISCSAFAWHDNPLPYFYAVCACVLVWVLFTVTYERRKNIIFAYNVIKVCSILEIKHNALQSIQISLSTYSSSYLKHIYSQQHSFSSLSYIACYPNPS